MVAAAAETPEDQANPAKEIVAGMEVAVSEAAVVAEQALPEPMDLAPAMEVTEPPTQ